MKQALGLLGTRRRSGSYTHKDKKAEGRAALPSRFLGKQMKMCTAGAAPLSSPGRLSLLPSGRDPARRCSTVKPPLFHTAFQVTCLVSVSMGLIFRTLVLS